MDPGARNHLWTIIKKAKENAPCLIFIDEILLCKGFGLFILCIPPAKAGGN